MMELHNQLEMPDLAQVVAQSSQSDTLATLRGTAEISTAPLSTISLAL